MQVSQHIHKAYTHAYRFGFPSPLQLFNSPKKSRKGRDVQKLQMYSIYPTHLVDLSL